MTSERVDTKPQGQTGEGPLNLPLEGCPTRDAFLLVSSKLCRDQYPDYSHFGGWKLLARVDELPEELAKTAQMLGLGDNVRFNIRAKVELKSSHEPDYDSVNKITVDFVDCRCSVTYEYDNRSWKFGRRDSYHRMSLRYEGPDSNRSHCPETKRQARFLKEMGVFKKREEAFGGLCEFLNHARFKKGLFRLS